MAAGGGGGEAEFPFARVAGGPLLPFPWAAPLAGAAPEPEGGLCEHMALSGFAMLVSFDGRTPPPPPMPPPPTPPMPPPLVEVAAAAGWLLPRDVDGGELWVVWVHMTESGFSMLVSFDGKMPPPPPPMPQLPMPPPPPPTPPPPPIPPMPPRTLPPRETSPGREEVPVVAGLEESRPVAGGEGTKPISPL